MSPLKVISAIALCVSAVFDIVAKAADLKANEKELDKKIEAEVSRQLSCDD